ncbi:MAG TPA: sigma-54 dependent transcriptional regulator [Bdellovibrionota bacterium]|nr:sigma-54 dependent transcriptional regulator [Bdellovibrionota bacterium]
MESTQNQQSRDSSQEDINSDAPLVLIVDDDKASRMRLSMMLKHLPESESGPVRVKAVTSIPEALTTLAQMRAHVLLLDKDLGTDKKNPDHNGLNGIPRFLHLQPHLQIIMITGSNSVEDSVQAMKLGAQGYILKETKDDLILLQIQRTIQSSETALENYKADRLQSSGTPPRTLGGKSHVFRQLLASAELLAESNRPILILGETGTGKTALAEHIHQYRGKYLKQASRQLICVNVGALPPDIVDRELFGHEKGAYTDAGQGRPGYFELAGNTGTLFLDEIGEATLDLQVKLLTAIEKGEFYRLGGTTPIQARPKLILATNRNLPEMVKQKKFREDLYMRISSFTLRMPSLSERKEDIPDIVRALLPKACFDNNIHDVEFKDLPQDFLEYLMETKIEGNIRGIQHKLEHLMVYSIRDSRGKRNLKNWRGIPGLYVRDGDLPMNGPIGSKNSITFRDFISKPFDVLGPHFPGMTPFIKLIQEKLVEEARGKYETNAEIARALQLDASYTSRLRRGVSTPANGKKKKRSTSNERRSGK